MKQQSLPIQEANRRAVAHDTGKANKALPSIQPKLTVGEPNDQYEQEADKVADTVMSMPEASVRRVSEEDEEKLQTKSLFSQITPFIQRQSVEEDEPLQAKLVQKQTEEEDESLQTKFISKKGEGSSASTNWLENQLQGTTGSGSNLPDDTRASMENRFGTNFSSVRVHTDTTAVQMNKELQAQAFTHGNDIYFNDNKYSPESSSGKHLLAHELTHVVQQRPGTKMINRVVTPSPVSFHSYRQIMLMKLSDFQAYLQTQADWFTNSALTDEQREQIRNIILFTNDNISAVFGQVGMWYLNRFINEVSGEESDINVNALRSYASAASGNHIPFPLSSTPRSVQTALAMGKDIVKLREVFRDYILQDALNEEEFNRLRNRGYVDDVINYYTNAAQRPIFQAHDGWDFYSFILFNGETSRRPLMYDSTVLVQKVRNYHRFEKRALDRLVTNFGNTTRSKPLTLILHSAIDYNGHFHRDSNLTAVITNNHILTLMVEGFENLSDYQSMIGQLANAYGQNNLIDQVLITGHGEATSMELAGSVRQGTGDRAGHIRQVDDGIDVTRDDNQPGQPIVPRQAETATRAFFQEILNFMADPASGTVSPHNRIVFNACLTGSNSVSQAVSHGDAAQAGAEITAYITAHPSLARYLRDMANPSITSIGANAATYTVSLINSAGELNIITPDDPDITNSKLAYAETGTEPIGALRAVLEAWATDRTATISALQRRVLRAATNWDTKLIKKAYEIILDKYQQDGEGIRLVDQAVEKISEMKYESSAYVSSGFFYRYQTIPDLQINDDAIGLLSAIVNTDEGRNNGIRLALLQVWMILDAAKKSDFMTKIGSLTCNFSVRFTDIDFLENNNLINDLLGGTASDQAKFRLALIGVIGDNNNPGAMTYLNNLVVNQRFPAALNVNTALGGASTEIAVLTKIGAISASTSTTNTANIHLPGSTTNTIFGEVYNAPGRVENPYGGTVYEQPNTASAILTTLNEWDEVDIIGRLPGWYAITYHGSSSADPITAFIPRYSVEVLTAYRY